MSIVRCCQCGMEEVFEGGSELCSACEVDERWSKRYDKLSAALVHVVEALEALADREGVGRGGGHEGDEETGQCFEDCMKCRVEAALAHAEEVSKP